MDSKTDNQFQALYRIHQILLGLQDHSVFREMALPAPSPDVQKIPLSGFWGAVIGRFRAGPTSFQSGQECKNILARNAALARLLLPPCAPFPLPPPHTLRKASSLLFTFSRILSNPQSILQFSFAFYLKSSGTTHIGLNLRKDLAKFHHPTYTLQSEPNISLLLRYPDLSKIKYSNRYEPFTTNSKADSEFQALLWIRQILLGIQDHSVFCKMALIF